PEQVERTEHCKTPGRDRASLRCFACRLGFSGKASVPGSGRLPVANLQLVAVGILEERGVVQRSVLRAEMCRFEGPGAGSSRDFGEPVDLLTAAGAKGETGTVGPVPGVEVDPEKGLGPVVLRMVVANGLTVFRDAGVTHSR